MVYPEINHTAARAQSPTPNPPKYGGHDNGGKHTGTRESQGFPFLFVALSLGKAYQFTEYIVIK